jgi:hypothetical protein
MLKFDDQEYMRVKEFKFLRTILTEDNDITTEIKQRIIMANNFNCVVLVVKCVVLLIVSFLLLIVLFYVLFVCKCVLYYCHRVSTQLQLTNISQLAMSSRNIYTRRF